MILHQKFAFTWLLVELWWCQVYVMFSWGEKGKMQVPQQNTRSLSFSQTMLRSQQNKQLLLQLTHMVRCKWWRKRGGSMWVTNQPLTIDHMREL